MKEFEYWKRSVVQVLGYKNIPVPSWNMLVIYWNSNYSVEDVLKACMAEHLSEQSKSSFDSAERCGCFHCTKFFQPEEIHYDCGTAKCPYCNIDSVLPDTANFPLSEDLLVWLSKRQFGNNVHAW